jgi:hypothetical protein
VAAGLCAASGALIGHPQARRPSVDVTDLVLYDSGSRPPQCTTIGDFRIINTTGDGSVTPEAFYPAMEFIGPQGVRTPCQNVIFTLRSTGQPGGEIPDGDFAYVAYEMQCAEGCPANTRETKNYIEVKIFDRDKLFFSSGGWTY